MPSYTLSKRYVWNKKTKKNIRSLVSFALNSVFPIHTTQTTVNIGPSLFIFFAVIYRGRADSWGALYSEPFCWGLRQFPSLPIGKTGSKHGKYGKAKDPPAVP